MNALGSSASAVVNDTSQTVETTSAALTTGANNVSFAGNSSNSSVDGSECSLWRSFESGSEHMLEEPLEWVGDLYDLRDSDETIPRYIRSLRHEDETLSDAAHRLSK